MRSLGRAPFSVAVIVLVLAAARSAAADATIVALGDSLTAGFGIAAEEAYPARLEARLRREGYAYRVVNAGVSGDTSAGGVRRVDWVLRLRPEIAIVALGANDALRGLPIPALEANLSRIVEHMQAGGARVLLAGMRAPPNYGEPFAREFAAAFERVARGRRVAFMPFLLDGVAAVPRLNLADGIHPTAEGHQVIADRLWRYLRPLLTR
jgi:acyl-CoA thioesterase I